jgi:octaprenyl-diphosphate synthase
MTLPLIYALSKASKTESRRIRRIVAKDKKKKAQIKQVIDFVVEQGGINMPKKN